MARGHILYSSYDDFVWSNQQVGEEEGCDSEIPCSFCGRAVFGGIEALYIHYLASQCVQDEVMTCQMPEVNPLPLNPNPILPLPNPSLHIPVTPSNQDNQEPQFVQIQDQCSTTNEEHAPCRHAAVPSWFWMTMKRVMTLKGVIVRSYCYLSVLCFA